MERAGNKENSRRDYYSVLARSRYKIVAVILRNPEKKKRVGKVVDRSSWRSDIANSSKKKKRKGEGQSMLK